MLSTVYDMHAKIKLFRANLIFIVRIFFEEHTKKNIILGQAVSQIIDHMITIECPHKMHNFRVKFTKCQIRSEEHFLSVFFLKWFQKILFYPRGLSYFI